MSRPVKRSRQDDENKNEGVVNISNSPFANKRYRTSDNIICNYFKSIRSQYANINHLNGDKNKIYQCIIDEYIRSFKIMFVLQFDNYVMQTISNNRKIYYYMLHRNNGKLSDVYLGYLINKIWKDIELHFYTMVENVKILKYPIKHKFFEEIHCLVKDILLLYQYKEQLINILIDMMVSGNKDEIWIKIYKRINIFYSSILPQVIYVLYVKQDILIQTLEIDHNIQSIIVKLDNIIKETE